MVKHKAKRKGLVKIWFTLACEEGYPPVSTESLWASDAGDGLWRIDNIPFFTDAATLGDVVSVRKEDGQLWFQEWDEESDNSLLWVIIMSGSSQAVIAELMQAGCEVEKCDENFFAVNVPPTVKLKSVQSILRKREKRGELEYSEPILRQ